MYPVITLKKIIVIGNLYILPEGTNPLPSSRTQLHFPKVDSAWECNQPFLSTLGFVPHHGLGMV
jgi:hypothetical protein